MIKNPPAHVRGAGGMGSVSGESHGQRNLVGCSLRGHRESDTAEHTRTGTYLVNNVVLALGVHHGFNVLTLTEAAL